MQTSTRRSKPKILTSLKILFVLAAVALNASCASAAVVPAWNGRLFFGDHDREGLSRNSAKDPDFISCRDPKDKARFDDFIAMSRADFKSFLDTFIGGCEKWKGRKGSILIESELFFRLLSGQKN